MNLTCATWTSIKMNVAMRVAPFWTHKNFSSFVITYCPPKSNTSCTGNAHYLWNCVSTVRSPRDYSHIIVITTQINFSSHDRMMTSLWLNSNRKALFGDWQSIVITVISEPMNNSCKWRTVQSDYSVNELDWYCASDFKRHRSKW